MLFAGWEVRIVKNCDRGLENAARGHSFSPYGPTLSQQITSLFFSCDKMAYKLGLHNFVIDLVYLSSTNHRKKSNERTSE